MAQKGKSNNRRLFSALAQETSDLESLALLDVTDRDMSVESGEEALRKGSGDFEVEATQSEPIIQCLCGL